MPDDWAAPQIFDTGLCRDLTKDDCTATEVFEAGAKTCRARVAADCLAHEEFQYGLCRLRNQADWARFRSAVAAIGRTGGASSS